MWVKTLQISFWIIWGFATLFNRKFNKMMIRSKMGSLVGTYQYTYGAGNTPNRQLEFYGDNTKIWGVAQGKTNGSWKFIGKISEDSMVLEGASTTEKIQILIESRKNSKNPEYPPDRKFNELSYTDRVKVIENLQPSGHYRVTISNHIGANPFFEEITKLTFFNPS